MKIDKASEDLLAKALDNAQLWVSDLFYVAAKGPTCDLRNEYDLFLLLVLPPGDEVDDVWVLQTFDQINLFADALAVGLG